MIANYDNENSKLVTDSSSKGNENQITSSTKQNKTYHNKHSILIEGSELYSSTSNSLLNCKTTGTELSHIV